MFNYNSNLSAYQLTISLDKYTVAVEWLLKSGCDFNAYFSHKSQEVRFIFSVIPQLVINKLNEKYNPAPAQSPEAPAVTIDETEDLLAFFYIWTHNAPEATKSRIYKAKLADYYNISIDESVNVCPEYLAALGIALSAPGCSDTNEHRGDAVMYACEMVYDVPCLYDRNTDEELSVEAICERIVKRITAKLSANTVTLFNGQTFTVDS